MKKIGIVYSDALLKYSFGLNHPMNSYRVQYFYKMFDQMFKNKYDRFLFIAPTMVHEDILSLFHTHSYIDRVKDLSHKGIGLLDYGDTPAFKGVFEAASIIVGGTIAAAEKIIQHQVKYVFDPASGLHHARSNSAAGFCVFNDVAILIKYLRIKYRIKSILYIDIDAHHGDGVFYAFNADPDVIIVDFHESWKTLYPGTGRLDEHGVGAAVGTKLNFNFKPGSDDTVFFSAFDVAKEFINKQTPEFIITQVGADALDGDPLSHLRFSSKIHYHLIQFLKNIAITKKSRGVLALGGGGYNAQNTANAWINVINALLE